MKFSKITTEELLKKINKLIAEEKEMILNGTNDRIKKWKLSNKNK